MVRRCVVFAVVAACCWQAGCSRGPKGPKRVPVFPVSGILKVDGEPAPFVRVNMFPAGKDVEDPMRGAPHYAVTDNEGKFKITTYDSGDGAPAGDYVLALYWEKAAKTVPFDNPDEPRLDPAAVRFNRKYSYFSDSSPKVTVEEKSNDLGTLELKTK